MKKIVKNNIIGFVIGALVFGVIGVCAASQITSDQVEYKDGKSTTQAINELYQRQSRLPKAYSVGQTITVAGEQYYVIADSPKSQDYVTLLKADPIFKDEMLDNNYGQGYINRNTYDYVGEVYYGHGGGVAYYSSPTCGYVTPRSSFVGTGCASEGATSYDSSDIKHVVDDWANTKFTNNELKLVDGYSVRLIKFEEIQSIGWPSCTATDESCLKEDSTPEWIYDNRYDYWTMSQWNNDDSRVWMVSCYGGTIYRNNVNYVYGTVRPVINVYKNKL